MQKTEGCVLSAEKETEEKNNKMVVYLIVLAMLIYESIVDIKFMKIDVRAAVIMGIAGVVVGRLLYAYPVIWLLYGVLIGGLLIFTSWLTKKRIGYGDGIIFAVMGLCINPAGVLWVLWASMLVVGIYGFVGVICGRRKKEDALPFIPFVTVLYALMFIFVLCGGGSDYA